MNFIDTHCHLQYHPINAQIDSVIEKCKEQNITTLVCVGTDLNSSKEAGELINNKQLENKGVKIFGSCGIHPTDVNNYPQFPEKEFEEILTTKFSTEKGVFIGECGLDYFHQNTSPQLQIEFFERQIVLAKKHNKILIVHIRNAFEDTKNILKKYFPMKFISHCFSGEYKDATIFIDNGGYISFALNITYPKNIHLLEVLKKVPVDRILFETDAPFLPPQKLRGKTNYPYYVIEGYKLAAQLLQMDLQTLCVRVNENFQTLISFIS